MGEGAGGKLNPLLDTFVAGLKTALICPFAQALSISNFAEWSMHSSCISIK